MIIQPLGNRLFIKQDPIATHTDGGIALPKTAQKVPDSGTVLRAGPGELLKNGKTKESGAFQGDHVLYTDSGNEVVMVGDDICSIVNGEHIFARQVNDYPIYEYNGVTIGFDHEALRDMVYVLPTEPPKTLGEKGLLEAPLCHRKKHQDLTGLVLTAGHGYLCKKTGRYIPTDYRLVSGVIVKFDISVPWGTYVEDTDGKKHYVCICGVSDIFGIIGKIEQE